MRIRTRSYAAAFAASAGTIAITTDAFRSSSSPLFSTRTRNNHPQHTSITETSMIQSMSISNTRKRSNTNRNNAMYASRTKSETETETDRETIDIRRKSYGAPVVDSTLLRFISQQKKIPEVFREAGHDLLPEEAAKAELEAEEAKLVEAAKVQQKKQNNINNNRAAATNTNSNSASLQSQNDAPITSSSFMDTEIFPNNGNIIGNDSFADADADADYASATNEIKKKLAGGAVSFGGYVDNDVDDDEEKDNDFVLSNTLAMTSPSSASTSWMAQFGSKNVAQLLLKDGDGMDEASAKTAGDAVERYCVVRTARRRIRRFLKERDTLWASSSSSSSSSTGRSELESLAASDMATSPAASLLLSYAEQRETQRRRDTSSDTEDDDDDCFDPESTPSYGFEDVLDVMRDYGLKGNDLSVLLTHSPNLALRVPSKSFLRKGQTDEAETLEETLDRSLKGLLMTTLKLRRYDARKVLRTCPGLLSVRGSKSAVQVVTIMTKLGVSPSSLARDKASLPVLLSRSPAGLFRLVAFLSSTAIRMPLEQIGPLLRRKVGRELMDALLPVPNMSYSKVVKGNSNTVAANANVDVNATSVVVSEEAASTSTSTTTLEDDAAAWSRTRIERQERIERTYAGMIQTARILKAQIGTQDLSKVVAAYPNVLLLDAENQILPVARYLMGGLGIWQNDLSGVLQLYPTLLGTKIEDLERVVSYVLTLGVDEDDLAGIFRAFPGLFALPIEDMEAVVSYLESIGVQDIGSFVTKLPPVLGYAVQEELKPKWEFLKTVCLQPEFELKEFPAYFSYPFDRVIKTRFNYLAYKGISIRFVSMRIDTVLRFGDVDFATKVALDDDHGDAFKNFGDQRGSASAKGLATAHKLKKKKNHNHKNVRAANTINSRNEAKAALAAAQRLSEDIDNAKDLTELNRIFREATPLRNRSLGDSLPSLKPTRPKRKQKGQQQGVRPPKQQQQQQTNEQQPQPQRQQQQQSRNNNRNTRNQQQPRGGEDGTFPCPA